jgi:hypothetical protein
VRYCSEAHRAVADDRELEGDNKRGRRLKGKVGDATDSKRAQAA